MVRISSTVMFPIVSGVGLRISAHSKASLCSGARFIPKVRIRAFKVCACVDFMFHIVAGGMARICAAVMYCI
jgi:hypothetical protein